MNEFDKLRYLLDLAEEWGIDVRRSPAGGGTGHPGGALVRLGERELLFVDPTAGPADQLNAVVQALRGHPQANARYLPPSIRALLNDSAEQGEP